MKHTEHNMMRLAAALLLCLAMVAGLTATALAGKPSVTYVDENGGEHKVTEYSELKSSAKETFLQSGTYVTKNVNNGAIVGYEYNQLTIEGDVILIIRDDSIFTRVWIKSGASLTIYGAKGREEYTLYVKGSNGIEDAGLCGPGRLTLCSGSVEAQSNVPNHPAFGADGGTYIKGGYLEASAYKESNSAAVGGTGPVFISGGTVIAEALAPNESAAIGGNKDTDGTVTITGGNITAISSSHGAAIGGGRNKAGNVTISGGTIDASTISRGAGIGNGAFGHGGSVNISGGTIKASGYTGIGGSYKGTCGDISISGGSINARGRNHAIGSDAAYLTEGNIIITGGNVNTVSENGSYSGISTDFAEGKKLILGWTSLSDRISGNFVKADYQARNVELRNYFWLGNESTVATGANLDQRTLIPSQTANILRVRFYSHNNDTPWQETVILSGETPADPGNPYADDPDKEFLGWRAGSYDGPEATFGAMTEDLDLYAAYRSIVTLRYNNGKFDDTVYVNMGDTLPRPEDPYDTAEGVHFSYWYNAEADHTPYDFTTPVNDGFTLTAWWWYPGIDFEGGYTAEYTDFASIIGHGNTLQGDVVVMNTCQKSGRLRVSGKVRLILCDGNTLYASGGIEVPEGSTLEIYGQSEGTGRLYSNSAADYQAGIGSSQGMNSGAIHIYGGTVEIHGGKYAAGIGGGYQGNGNVTVHGGHVEATGGDLAPGIGGGALGGGTVTLRGGSLKATGGSNAKAINASTVNFAWDSYNIPLHLEADSIGGNIVFQKGFLLENTEETALPGNIPGNVTMIPAMGMFFDANGGSGSMDYRAVVRKGAFTLPACEFAAPEGKTFDCWQSDNGGIFHPGLTCTFIQGRAFKALWATVQHLSFNSVTGENPEGSITKTWGDAPFTNAVTGAQTGVTWMSTDETVATVDGNGQVTLTGTGEARIIATAGKTAEFAKATAGYLLTVEPLTIANPDITVNGSSTYTGSEIIPEVTVMYGNEVIPAEWITLTAENNIDAGTATVTATGATGSRYCFSATTEFTIEPKPVTVSGITAKNKHFNDDTDAELDCSGAAVNGLAEGDEVNIGALGEFADAASGTGKTVNITSITLEGRDAGNYVLAASGQQATATATIYAPHTVTFAGEDGTALTDEAFAAQIVRNGSYAEEPEITDANRPVKDGWRFTGWQWNGEPFDFGTELNFGTTTTVTLQPRFHMLYPVYAVPENVVTTSAGTDPVTLGDSVTAEAPNVNPANAEQELIGFSVFYTSSSAADADIVRLDYTLTAGGSTTEAEFTVPVLPTESAEGYIIVRAEYALNGNLLDSLRNADNNHIEIRSGDDLVKLAKWMGAGHNMAGETVDLMNDIDMAGTGFNGFPRNRSTDADVFGGTFNGNGHTIRGINIRSNGGAGFFNVIAGTVQDLTLAGSVFGDGNDNNYNYVGGIAAVVGSIYDTDGNAVQTGQILNCVSLLRVTNDTQSGYSGYTGGIAGKNIGTVSNCTYLGMDSEGLYSIAPVGNNEGTVSNCTALYAVEGNRSEYQGIAVIQEASCAEAVGGYFPQGSNVTLTLSAAPKAGWTLKGFKYQIYNDETYNYDDVNLTCVGGDSYLLTGIDRNVTILPNYVYNALSGLEQDAKNRYQITSAEDLRAMAQAVRALYGCSDMSFVLTEDLHNVGVFGGIAVGKGDEYLTFDGNFDGGGHTISGMRISSDSAYGVGFIGQLGGTLANLTLENCTVTGTGEYAEVGMLAGSGYGSMTNCRVIGGRVEGAYAGAIMGTGYMEGQNNFYDAGVTVISDGEIIPTGECGTSEGDRTEYNAARASAYRVSFEDGLGNRLTADQLVMLDGVAEKPVFEEAPVREHYTFTDTWQKEDGNEYTFSAENAGDVIYANTTLFAVWEADPVWTVTESDGEEDGQRITLEVFREVAEAGWTIPDCSLTAPTGKEFDRWQYNGATYESGDPLVFGSDITLTAQWKDADYAILTEDGITGGTIGVPATARYGDSVSVTVVPETGWTLTELTYRTGDAEPVAITPENGAYLFGMPAGTVTVGATFTAADYTVTAQITGNGMLYIGGEVIGNGETVTAHYGDVVFLLPETGFRATACAVTDTNGNAVEAEVNGFVMPAASVTVAATFAEYIPEFGPADFTLPTALTRIEESAFEGLVNMTVVDASHCEQIGKWAFRGTGLTQIMLPKDCNIHGDAFEGLGTVYVFSEAGGLTETYCSDPAHHCQLVTDWTERQQVSTGSGGGDPYQFGH